MQSDESRNVGQELEMGMARMDMLKAQMDSLRNQRDAIVSVLMDYESSIEVISSLKTGHVSDTLVPIGAMVYLKARVLEGETCLLNEGAGVYMQRDLDDALSRIKGRKESLEKAVESMTSQLENVVQSYNQLAARTQELYGQQMLRSNGPKGEF
jgi:prefoldin alpha subunit